VGNATDKDFTAGINRVLWDAEESTSGIYFYRIKAADFSETKKMLLIK
jgi:hypothetical protein